MPRDFGVMSYGYFKLLRREVEAAEIQHHYPAAAIQAMLCNLKRDPDKIPRAFNPWDFMPGWKWTEAVERPVASLSEIAAELGIKK